MKELKDEIRDVIGYNKANFNFKTIAILKSYLCCRICMNRKTLRNNPEYRSNLFYEKGFEALDKELDVAYII